MNKRGMEYSVSIVMEYVLLIIIAVMLAGAIYKNPHEERINQLKAIDLSLALDSVSGVKGDVVLGFDLGKGMNVKVEDEKIEIYRKSKAKLGEEVFVKNSYYGYKELEEGKYGVLFIIKEKAEEKEVIRFEGH